MLNHFQASLALLECLHWEVPGRHPNQWLIHPNWLFSMQMSTISCLSHFRIFELPTLLLSINLHKICSKKNFDFCAHVLHLSLCKNFLVYSYTGSHLRVLTCYDVSGKNNEHQCCESIKSMIHLLK